MFTQVTSLTLARWDAGHDATTDAGTVKLCFAAQSLTRALVKLSRASALTKTLGPAMQAFEMHLASDRLTWQKESRGRSEPVVRCIRSSTVELAPSHHGREGSASEQQTSAGRR